MPFDFDTATGFLVVMFVVVPFIALAVFVLIVVVAVRALVRRSQISCMPPSTTTARVVTNRSGMASQ